MLLQLEQFTSVQRFSWVDSNGAFDDVKGCSGWQVSAADICCGPTVTGLPCSSTYNGASGNARTELGMIQWIERVTVVSPWWQNIFVGDLERLEVYCLRLCRFIRHRRNVPAWHSLLTSLRLRLLTILVQASLLQQRLNWNFLVGCSRIRFWRNRLRCRLARLRHRNVWVHRCPAVTIHGPCTCCRWWFDFMIRGENVGKRFWKWNEKLSPGSFKPFIRWHSSCWRFFINWLMTDVEFNLGNRRKSKKIEI